MNRADTTFYCIVAALMAGLFGLLLYWGGRMVYMEIRHPCIRYETHPCRRTYYTKVGKINIPHSYDSTCDVCVERKP